MNWQNEILKNHTGQTGFFKTLEMEQNTNPQNFCEGDPVEIKSNEYNSFGEIIEVDPHLQECKVNCVDAKFAWFKFSELTHMQDPEIETQCENCGGEGSVEGAIECFQPASNCCGGCYPIIECDECNGSGEISKCVGDIIEEINEFTQH